MGIIGNNFRLNTGVQYTLGDVMSRTPGNAMRYSNMCFRRSNDGNSSILAGTSNPVGGYAPSVFMMPQVSGEMVMRSFGQGDLSADLFPSRNMSVDFTGMGNLEATAALVVSMLVNMAGSGNLQASISGRADASVDMTGQGDMSANLSALANMVVNMLGEGDLEATIAAYGNMSVDMLVTGTGLTIENVGFAVWSALAANSNIPLTMGNKLNSAASAGDPWGTALPGGYADGEAGKILSQIQALVAELHQIQGLKEGVPSVNDGVTWTAGDITIDISGDGVNDSTFERRP